MTARKLRKYRIALDTGRFSQEIARHGWESSACAAKNLGVPESTLSKILSRKTEPSALTIDRLVTGLDVPYGALFRREEIDE